LLDTLGHLQHAKHNEQFAEFLESTSYPDWRATALFYAALHYVQSYFLKQIPARPFKTHAARDTAIRLDVHIGGIWNDYRSLKDWSLKTRYEGKQPDEKDFKNDILKSLETIRKTIYPYVASP